MWNKVEDKLPDNDREVLCVVRNYLDPHWLSKEIASYIDNKWYFKTFFFSSEDHEIVKWCEIPEEDDLRTSEEWNKIYNKFITDFDGWDRNNFQYSYFEELITEKEFTRRLLYSTQFYAGKK